MSVKSILSTLVLLGTTILLYAQQQTLIIRDTDTGQPVANVYFQYGSQMGQSDAEGRIALVFAEAQPLRLSHLTYGERTLTATEVQAALSAGTLTWSAGYQALQPVTVIALRRQQVLKDELDFSAQERLAHDGGAILLQSPAIGAIRKAGGYGFDPVFRGFKYDQLNVVIDGAQSATAACPNRMDPPTSQVAPNMMERVEILKGPHALRFGNSFGGTIQFTSVDPVFAQATDWYGRWSARYEGNGNVRRTEGALGVRTRAVDWSVFASWSEGDDYRVGNDAMVGADFQRISLGTRLGWALSDNQQLIVSATRNLARDTDFPALPMDLRNDDTWMLNARHEWQIGGEQLQSWQTILYGTFVDHRMDNLLKPLDPRMLNAETEAITRTYGGRTEGKWTGANGQLFAGLDTRVEEARGERVREFLRGPMAGRVFTDNAWQDARILRPAIFAEYQRDLGSYQLIASGRLEVNQAEVRDAAPEFLEQYTEAAVTQVNPAFSLGLRRSLGAGWQAGLWLGRSQRSGSLTERFINYFPVGLDPYELLGNPDLQAEVNHQADLRVQYAGTRNGVEVSLFAARLHNFITSEIRSEIPPRLPMSPGVRQFVNRDRAVLAGFEVSWEFEFFESLRHRLDAAYTYGQDPTREEPLPEIAPLDLRYRLLGSFLQNRLQTEAGIRYVAQQDRVAASFGERTTPSFTLLDVAASYQVTPAIQVRAGVDNLLDETFYEHLNRAVRVDGRPPLFAPGRNVHLTVSTQF